MKLMGPGASLSMSSISSCFTFRRPLGANTLHNEQTDRRHLKSNVPMILEHACRHTKSSEGVPQIILVNKAISVLVHDCEGLRSEQGESFMVLVLKKVIASSHLCNSNA